MPETRIRISITTEAGRDANAHRQGYERPGTPGMASRTQTQIPMNKTTETPTVKTYRQFTNSRRIYELNCDTHHIATRPIWSLAFARNGEPLPHGLAEIETSNDATTARLISHDWTGSIRVTVTFGIHPRTTVTESFQVEIEPVPHASPELKLSFSQHRDRQI
jgi:hypothetical protein